MTKRMTNKNRAEEMSVEDLDIQIAALKEKKKELQMKKAAFWAEVDARKEEILKRWGCTGKQDTDMSYQKELEKIAIRYGCSIEKLLEYIQSDRQVDYFQRHRQ